MDEPGRDAVRAAAEAVADAAPVDWEARVPTDLADTGRLQSLKLVARIAAAYRSIEGDAATARASVDPGGDAPRRDALFTWGHLEVLEKVGEGAFGEVYRAYDTVLDRSVALKLWPRGATPVDGGSHAFIREARRLARLRSANVVAVHGAEEHDGRVGLWTDLITGRTLEKWLAEDGPLSAREAALVGIDVCRALSAVHAAGLAHGDVKPTNVMRERGGRIVLMDFGAGAESAGGPPTQGTPLTMAPELLRGGAQTPATDVYSVGVLLYRMVSGAYPVEATTVDELLAAHDRSGVVPLGDVRPDLSAGLVRVVERALASDPARRYASAGAMERALIEIVASADSGWKGQGEASAQPGPDSTGLRRGARWWRWAAGASLLAGVAAVAYVASRREAGVPPLIHVESIAVLPFEVADAMDSESLLGLQVADGLINRLGRVPEVRVRSTGAVSRFVLGHPEPRGLGRMLAVDAVLDGRIERSGDRLWSTVELVSSNDGAVLWAMNAERSQDDVPELEDAVAKQLAVALRGRLSASEVAALAWRPPSS